jgi:hypothetical protein
LTAIVASDALVHDQLSLHDLGVNGGDNFERN